MQGGAYNEADYNKRDQLKDRIANYIMSRVGKMAAGDEEVLMIGFTRKGDPTFYVNKDEIPQGDRRCPNHPRATFDAGHG